MAEQQQDVDTLKRRGRRRCVGAVALALLAVIVLPMVFDPEPRRGAPPVSVRVPGEDDQPFTPKVTPKAAEKKAEEKPAVAEKKAVEEKKAKEKKAEEKKAVVEKNAPDGKAEAAAKAAAERARAEAALASGEFIVPVGAFANPEA